MKELTNKQIGMVIIGLLLALGSVLTVVGGDLPTKYQIRKAMDEYRAENPDCEMCGCSKNMFRQAVYVKYKPTPPPADSIWSEEGYIAVTNRLTARDLLKMYNIEIVAKNLPVHHVSSQKPFPHLAADKNTNFVTFCWSAHGWLGHPGRFYRDHNSNLRETMKAVRAAYSNNVESFNSTVEEGGE